MLKHTKLVTILLQQLLDNILKFFYFSTVLTPPRGAESEGEAGGAIAMFFQITFANCNYLKKIC